VTAPAAPYCRPNGQRKRETDKTGCACDTIKTDNNTLCCDLLPSANPSGDFTYGKTLEIDFYIQVDNRTEEATRKSTSPGS
jgi:hypothetical protein